MTVTLHEAQLENVLQKIARIIAREHGLQLVIRGGMAYIDLEKRIIYLPNISLKQYRELLEQYYIRLSEKGRTRAKP